MINLRPILQVNGILLAILAAAMLLPAFIGYILGNPDWKVFLFSAFITAFIGSGLFITNRGFKGELNIRQAFVFTSSSWAILPVFGALPLYYSGFGLTFTDAYFEAVAGFTTTGSTVISGLDTATPELLLWRALLQWLGGIGIIVFAIAILPMLRIGGMQLFRSESSEKEKILPRAAQIANAIAAVYGLITLVCAITYWLCGMSGFDAICHALTTVSTAGFSTYDASFGHFQNPKLEYASTIFMLVSALPFLLYYQMLRGRHQDMWRNTQVRWFLAIYAMSTAIMALWLVTKHPMSFEEAFRLSAFNVASIVTTTGYASTDYTLWGSFAVVFMFLLGVMGGCSGSTTGGIKVFRYQVLFETAKSQINQLIQPHGVFLPKYNHKPISDAVSNSVMTYFILFAMTFTVTAMLLSLMGLDYITSLSAAASAVANVGPGLGPIIGPSGNYAPLPDGAKYLLCFTMIAGRLELFTVLVLFSPSFWRD
ncbi:MAG: TrkH family potassium uptake protein [Alphaproteobacteria bacterium]|nr:TrkH family potassium uptake protein [Alphaproteobacteria bacterium]